MSSLIGLLSLLLTIAATSYALSCTECMSPSSTCSGNSGTCPSGQVCGTAYLETTKGGKKTEFVMRSCTPSSECNIKGSTSTAEAQLRMVTSCCNTDNCSPSSLELPAKGTNLNGLVCRSCVSDDSTWCYTPDTVQCTGDENMCLLQSTKMSGSASKSAAYRGCATKSICDLGSTSKTIGSLLIEEKTICTSGGTSVYKFFLTPAIACLLLLKLFF
ncbi:phospholipase A2 inhibitor and Ly6/PLAUR domain-containing protein-like [Anomaloglossus baeobatrachus]|uniref:phospholipase A2 inhibitor and Ly6/PLAUR domain-containing protein-like n=1 Tax=Anomaloglossus baeobatrachus TaxID=238106 RepID=UPI003F5006EE